MLEIFNLIAAVRALIEPERYGVTRDEARAAVNNYIDGDQERARLVRARLASYTFPYGEIPVKR